MSGTRYKARRSAFKARVRHLAHQEFDAVWQAGIVERREAYRQIGVVLGRSASRSHLGNLNPSQLKKVRAWAKSQLANKSTAFVTLPEHSND